MLCERCQRLRRADAQQSSAGCGEQRQIRAAAARYRLRSDRLLDPAVGHCGHQQRGESCLDLLLDRDRQAAATSANTTSGQCQRYQEYDLRAQKLQRRHAQHGAHAALRRHHSREQREERPGDGELPRSSLGSRSPPFTQSTVTRIMAAPAHAACNRPNPRRAQRTPPPSAAPKGRQRQTPTLRPVAHRKRTSAQREWPRPRMQTSWSRARPASTPRAARPERLAKRISPGHTR